MFERFITGTRFEKSKTANLLNGMNWEARKDGKVENFVIFRQFLRIISR